VAYLKVFFQTMTITLNNIGKRYNYEWIISKLNYQFLPGNAYAVIGPNGSGKSTLLQILASNLSPSEGDITYYLNNKKIELENVFCYIGFCAPYLELPEELSVIEMLQFHGKFKTILPSFTINGILEIAGLAKHSRKAIKYLSSGLKQRLKLSLCFYFDTPVILLDEPTTNLDEDGVKWYRNTVEPLAKNKLIIISSNAEREYSFCAQSVNVADYKQC
jgi:ABC-type multidrug transport system ATPase subunit